MICYGDPRGHSAMARTVGLPVAIATKMLLDGKSCLSDEKSIEFNFYPFDPNHSRTFSAIIEIKFRRTFVKDQPSYMCLGPSC